MVLTLDDVTEVIENDLHKSSKVCTADLSHITMFIFHTIKLYITNIMNTLLIVDTY